MASDTDTSTVELPADPAIKQLAHDVERESNQYAVPLLQDFYAFLAALDDDTPASRSDIRVDDPQSDVGSGAWLNFLDTLEDQDITDQDLGSSTYTLTDADA